jgi:hypothetical protein
MIDWLPSMFSGLGTDCCSPDAGITCVDDRITEMYVNFCLTIFSNLENKGLTGEVPSSLSELEKLISLKLGANSLSGPIPQLSEALSACDLYPSNKLTCYHSENAACAGNGIQGTNSSIHS